MAKGNSYFLRFLVAPRVLPLRKQRAGRGNNSKDHCPVPLLLRLLLHYWLNCRRRGRGAKVAKPGTRIPSFAWPGRWRKNEPLCSSPDMAAPMIVCGQLLSFTPVLYEVECVCTLVVSQRELNPSGDTLSSAKLRVIVNALRFLYTTGRIILFRAVDHSAHGSMKSAASCVT